MINNETGAMYGCEGRYFDTLPDGFDNYVSWKPGRISSYIVKIDGNLDIAVDKDKE